MEILCRLLLEKFPPLKIQFSQQQYSITVPLNLILPVLEFLKNHSQGEFLQLVDLCGVDYIGRIPRFEVVYHLLSLSLNQRIRLKVPVEEGQAVPSVASLYSCAVWFERETWDMYGIPFENSPDLRRILTDYEFEGHPLRKDFPLTGHLEVRYSEEAGRIVKEPVKLMQDYRTFDFLSPWEGYTPVNLSKDKAGQ